MEPVLRPAIEDKPQPFSYKSDKVMPWIYETFGQPTEVTNVIGVSKIARNGCVYGHPNSEKIPTKDKGKGKMSFHVEDEVEMDLNELLHKPEDKGEITNEEAFEFLKFITQSEYKSSEAHENVLMKVLNQAHVSYDITTDKLGGIMNNIVADNYIYFCDQEIPSEGIGHTSSLHISIMHNDCLIGKVLINNGSSLNVMSKRTLSWLPVDASYMKPSFMVVKAFDGSNIDIMGKWSCP
ncbi:hypothetical protein Lal_00046390 [Lupinus albus]|nr:hypothetical protein Lal_00046390 [Lupinus albus]